MNVTNLGAALRGAIEISLLILAAVASMNAAGQALPVPYQYCEAQAPEPNAIHRIDSNYRYPAAAAVRSFQGHSPYRCEPAWAQSTAIFNALDVCQWFVSGCSADASGICNDGRDDWTEYDFLAATLWSEMFSQRSAWLGNPIIEVHSGIRGFQQWTRHRYWGWDDPPRYAYLGVVERPLTESSSYPRCYGMAYLIGLFNGVANTHKATEESLKQIRSEAFMGARHEGAPIRYKVFYNQTGCSRSTVACLEDVAEVFIQRSAELDGVLARRLEYLWEQVTFRADKEGSFSDSLRLRVLNVDRALALWLDALASAILAKITGLTADMLADPPTLADTSAHLADLISAGRQGYRAVLIAHSQGNLFVNAAYDSYLAHSRQEGVVAGQDTGYVAASVIHIAPASAMLRGPHVLAEIDLVINGLRFVDGTPVAVNTLSADVMPVSRVDATGHGLVETYLDPHRRSREDIKQLILRSMSAL